MDHGGIRDAVTTPRRATQSTLHAPVLVSWTTDKEVPRLHGDVAGLGGGGFTTRGIAGTTYYTGGTVTLDADAFRSMPQAGQQGVAEHEFGHLVGLAHVSSKDELMYPQASSRTTYGHGDLTGLSRLGRLSCR